MNIYFIGMCISMAVYIVIGLLVSRKVKSVDDYYVAGRRAPGILIVGSLVASYASTGIFIGDSGEYYQGGMNGLYLCGIMTTSGYILGAVFFGRYLRRSEALTIPEFIGRRFHSKHVKNLATITAVATMEVYLISVLQGVGTLMNAVTGISYDACILMAVIVFTAITTLSGSSGVLITDTIMATLFTTALIVAVFFMGHTAGGWFHTLKTIAQTPSLRELLSWKGVPGVVSTTSVNSIIWGIINGIVWMSVAMVGPWQSSRYMMAKNESTVISSTIPSAFGIFLIESSILMSAMFVKMVNPDIADPNQVMIWGAMHMIPTILGVLLLTGILAAGISSATTFLSLIGASMSNDVVGNRYNKITVGRIAMLIASFIATLFCIFNPPALFWIMLFGGAIVASSWMPTIMASVLSKRLTKAGAYAGMLAGFVVCFGVRLYTAVTGVMLSPFLDHAFLGMLANIAAMVIVSHFTQVTLEEKATREKMFIMPESEKDPVEVKKALSFSKAGMLVGVVILVLLLIFWAVPFAIYS